MSHVLVVDNELSARETIQTFLEQAGYDVTIAAGLSEAQAFLASQRCDVVIADAVLLCANGLALLQQVRQVDEDIPVIVIAGEPDVSTAAEALRHGAYDYLVKPVTRDILARVVGHAAEKKRLLDDKRRLEAEKRDYQADLEKRVAERATELEQRHQELAALIEISRDISATLDLTEVLQRVTQRTAQVCGAHGCIILMLTEDGEGIIPSMFQLGVGQVDQDIWRQFTSAHSPMPVSQLPVVQHVIRERSPLFIPDIAALSLPKHLIESFGVKSVLIVPLISKVRVIGLMALDHVEQGREFTDRQVELAMAIGAHAAAAIENARLYEYQRQRVARRARMLELSRELRLSLDLPETLNRICQAIVQDLGWQQVILSLRDYETKTSRPVAMAGYDAETVTRTLALPPTPLGQLDILRQEFRISHSYYVDHQRRTAVTDYPDELVINAPASDPESGGWHPDNVLLVPIEGREGILGFISPDNPVNRLRPTLETVQELETFAAQAATAIENARLYEATRGQLARVEALAQASARVVAELDLDKTLAGVVQAGLEALGADRAAVYLEDEGHAMVEARYVFGLSPEYVQHVMDRIYQEPRGRVQGKIVPRWVRDAQSDPETKVSWEMARREGFHSYVVLPLTYRERSIGRLVFYYNQVHTYNEDDERLCQAIANQAAAAIESARLFEETQQQARDLGLLYEMGRLFASSLEATDVLDQIARRCTEVFDADLVLVRLIENDSLVVRGSYFRDPSEREKVEDLLTAHPIHLGEGIAGQVAASGQPAIHLSEDVSRLTLPGYVAYLRTREWVLVPMRIGETITGVLTLIRRSEKGPFVERDVTLAQGIADQTAIAIENTRLFVAEKRRVAQLKAISGVGKDIAAILDLNVLLHRVVNLLADVFGYYYTNILMVDEQAQEIVLTASAGQTGRAYEGYRLTIGSQGITGWVAKSGEPLLVNDVEQEPRYHFAQELADTRSELAVPIKLKGKVIGVLDVQSEQLNAFDEMHLSTLLTLADQMTVAIENAHLLRETREHVIRLEKTTRDLELIHQVSQVVSSSLDLTHIMETTVEQMVTMFQADHSGILLFDQAKTHGQVVAEHPSTGATAERFPVPGYLAAERIIAAREPLVIQDVWNDPLMATVREAMHRLDIRSMLIVPLIVKGDVVGSIGLDAVGRQRRFSAEEMALAQTVANQVSIAIENARLLEETRRRWQEAETLYRATQALATTLDLRQVFECILSELQQVVPYDSASVQLLRDGRLEIIGGRGFPNLDELLGITFDLSKKDNPNREVMRRRVPFIVDDASAIYARFREEPHAAAGIRAYLGVPLLFGDQLIGMLALDKREPSFYTSEHARLASAFAAQAAIAIENARLYEETQQRARQWEALTQVGRAIGSILDLDEVLQLILAQLEQVVPYDTVCLWLREGDVMCVQGTRGFESPEALVGYEIPIQEDKLFWKLVHTRQPFIIADAQQDDRFRGLEGTEWVRSWLGVPLLSKGQVIGLATIDKKEPDLYTAETAERALAFGHQAAIAIENARLYEETKRRAEEMTALYETTLDITAQLDMPRLLNAILARASDLLGATGGLIHLYDQSRERLTAVTSYNLEKDYTGLTLKVGEGVAGRVFQNGEPLIIDDYRAWDGKSSQLTNTETRSILGVPLKWQEQIVGVLDIIDNVRVRAFDEHDLRLLTPFANQATIAIQNARLLEETRQRARQWEALTQIGQAIGSILDLDQVLELILEQLEKVIPYDAVSLWLREGNVLHIRAVRGFETSKAHLDLSVTLEDDTLVQEMFSTGRPLSIADAQQDERFHGLADTEWVRSWLGVPLLSKGEVTGLLTINKHEPDLYTAETAERALAFGQQAALAIENARLYAMQRQRAAQLESLNVIATTISQVLDLDEVLNLIACQTAELMEAETIALPLLNEDGARLIYATAYGHLAADLVGRVKPLRDAGICSWVLRNKQAFYSDDLAADEREDKETKEALGLRTVISAPMVFKGKAIGAITAINRRDGGLFTRADIEERLQPLANQAAIAIGNARLYEETKRRAEEMTALYRTYLEIGTPTDLPDLLWAICDQAARLLGVDKGGLYLYDEAREELELVVSYKLKQDLTGTRIKLGTGVAGHVVQTGQPLTVYNYSHWEEQATVYKEEPFASVIGVPLKWQGRILGVLTLSEEIKRRAFTPDDERLLGLFAQQAAVAIESARLYEETRRHVEELTALHTIDVAIASTLNLDKVLQRVYEQVSAVMDIAAFHIALYDEEKDELYLPVIVDQGKQLSPLTLKIKDASGLTGWVVRTREPLWIEDMEKEQHALPVKAIAMGRSTRSLMVQPLITKDKLIGVISAQSYEPYAFDAGHRRLFSGIASQVAIAVENARLYATEQQRTAVLARALEQRQELDRLKTEFIQNVSHELRTPLSIARGYAELLDCGELGELQPDQREPVSIITRRVRMLGELVEGLTAILEAETQESKQELVDLTDLVRTLLDDFQVTTEQAGLTLKAEIAPDLPLISGDSIHLRRVLDNLLGNAGKFTPTGGSINVRLWSEDTNVVLEVTDTGIGIPPDQLERIFERFYQIDGSMSRRYGGSGLGLALVKEIVETHGGQVTVRSVVGQGSTFRVTLPGTPGE